MLPKLTMTIEVSSLSGDLEMSIISEWSPGRTSWTGATLLRDFEVMRCFLNSFQGIHISTLSLTELNSPALGPEVSQNESPNCH